MQTPDHDAHHLAPDRAHSDPLSSVPCKQCGYALAGLDPAGVCPECGLPIERSLTDDRLVHSAPEYLRQLHQGVFLVLAGIIAQILFILGMVGIGIAVAASTTGGTGFNALTVLLTIGQVVCGLVIAWGWWLFSTPDPAFTGRFDGSTARRVVRIAVPVNAGIALLNGVVAVSFPSSAGWAPGSGPNPAGAVLVISILLGLVGLVAWAVSFFASMLYLRWLCPRIPNWRAHKRAKTLMWLGPVLYTVGSLCVGLGPLVALVLYWNMLDWVRRDLKRIRAEIGDLPA